mgnify:FL=1
MAYEMHNLIINNSEKLFGEINIPGDKSITHRAIMLASLAQGKTQIQNYLISEDCMNTIKIMKLLGVNISESEENLFVEGRGINSLSEPNEPLYAGNSGTLMRLLSGIMAMQSFESTIVGDDSLNKRPMKRIIEPLKSMGAIINSNNSKAPLQIKSNKLKKPINFFSKIPSAQVKSCLIFAALFAEGESIIEEIAHTRDHTEKLLKHFNYPIEIIDKKVIIQGKKNFNAKQISIPSDISSAAFFIVAALIKKDSEIIIKNVGLNSFRTGILDVLIEMGGDIKILNKSLNGTEPIGDIHAKYSKLKPIKLSGDIIIRLIDELPILFIACTSCSGVCEFFDIEELRYKESDRIKSIEEGLKKLGIQTKSTQNSFKITGGKLNGGIVDSFSDHRIAMSFVIAGLVSEKPITIINTLNINTSFPLFYSTLRESGVQIYQS